MTSSNQSNEQLAEKLRQFSEQYITVYQQKHGCLPTIEHDDEWPSPC
jgi:hypothetical protein